MLVEHPRFGKQMSDNACTGSDDHRTQNKLLSRVTMYILFWSANSNECCCRYSQGVGGKNSVTLLKFSDPPLSPTAATWNLCHSISQKG